MNGFRVDVLKKPSFVRSGSDCTNNGITANHDEVVLVCEGHTGGVEVKDDTPALRLIKRKVMGMEFWIAAPLDADYEGRNAGAPYKFGGNYIIPPFDILGNIAIKVFDRKE